MPLMTMMMMMMMMMIVIIILIILFYYTFEIIFSLPPSMLRSSSIACLSTS